MAAEEPESPEPKITLKGGANLVGCKPVFTHDSKYLLVASGFVIKVFSVKSGKCVRQLKGHKATVKFLCLNPKNNYQILSCCQDQTLVKWDFTDGALLKRYKCPRQLNFMKPVNLEDAEFVGLTQKGENAHCIVRFSLPTTDPEVQFKKLPVPKKQSSLNPIMVSFGCQDDIFASLNREELIVQSLSSGKFNVIPLKTEEKTHYSTKEHFTVVACHPTQDCVATGSSIGSIRLWYNLFEGEGVYEKIHWHSLPVRCLSFTTEGSYLLSGGHECVLVKWQLNSRYQDFLPRVGAPIVDIATSADNLYYATAQSDNSIQVITSQFNVVQVFVGLAQANLDEAHTEQAPVGLLLDPHTGALVLNGRPGHLQFYNIQADKQLYSVDIVCQNYISPQSLEQPLSLTQLIKADFSVSGDWLVTVEYRNDNETTPEQRLKFWKYDAKNQTYTLNTSVETPHAEVVDTVRFRPMPADVTDQTPTVVTTSKDGCFKLWQLTDDSDIYRNRSCWNCEYIGYYHHNMPAGAADFSEDGSVLAVAFGSTLTLWDPDTNALRQSFQMRDNIRHLMFGCGTSSHLLAVTTQTKLSTLNLLTCSAGWTINIDVVTMCRHNSTGHIAVFTKRHQLRLYDMASPKPIYENRDKSFRDIIAAIFVPHAKQSDSDSKLPWEKDSQLYFFNSKKELLTLTAESEVAESRVNIAEHRPETPFSLLLSKERRRTLKAIEPQRYGGHHGKPGAKYLQEMLNTPAHVLPPVSSLCSSFMEQLMIKNTSASEKHLKDEDSDDESEDDDEDSDSEMEVDEEQSENTNNTKTLTTKDTESDKRETPKLAEPKNFSNLTIKSLSWINSL